jgi:hypothetical protein
MFKLDKFLNIQTIVGVFFLGLTIYSMGDFTRALFKTREGLDSTSTKSPDTSSSDQATKMRELNDQTLSDIQKLQELEKELYAKMEGLSANKKLTQKIKDDIIANIDELSQLRMNLYANLKNNYDNYQLTSITTSNTYDEQSTAVAVVEKELDNAKARLASMQDDKNNKMRYIGVNTYYGKQYDAHSHIMKIIIFMCIPIIIISILSNKGIIPPTIAAIVSAVIVAIGILFLFKNIVSIFNRDNMNYDRFDWSFDPSDAPTSDSEPDDSSVPWASKAPGTCIGQDCCDQGATYDSDQNICIIDGSNDSSSNDSSSNDSSSNDRTIGTNTESMCSMNNGGKYAPQYSSYSRSAPVDKTMDDTKMNNYVVFDSVSPL